MELNTILNGDSLEILKTLPDQSVNMCVTSPPYYGLRDYGEDGQIGLEETPDKYVHRLVDVFREVRRVLKNDGTLWLNIGDSYAHNGAAYGDQKSTLEGRKQSGVQGAKRFKKDAPGLKPKDLIGIPWMVAFALRSDGWYLRSEIIWSKPNCMPESVKDRPTNAHEKIFLMSKSRRYYYDWEAISEPLAESTAIDTRTINGNFTNKRPDRQLPAHFQPQNGSGMLKSYGEKRNKRTVWEVSLRPYKEAHFAVFPTDLITPCIMAGSKKGGVVLDPFFGSGTTGEVAIRSGRKFIGVELSSEYVDMATKRLSPFLTQRNLFEQEQSN